MASSGNMWNYSKFKRMLTFQHQQIILFFLINEYKTMFAIFTLSPAHNSQDKYKLILD